MTNENLAVISAIKSFKKESDIFKQVINNLVNEDADENLVILLLNPDLVDKIIEPDKYSEALDYLMHTYQVERSSIVRDKMLKRYEQKVQGPIEEARISSIPTKEAIEFNYRDKKDIKIAEDAARTFEDNPLKSQSTPKTRDIINSNNASKNVKKGANEIAESLDPGFKEAKKASDDFEKKHSGVKADVELPKVSVIPDKKVIQPKVEPKKSVKDENEDPKPNKPQQKNVEKDIINTSSPVVRATGELDNKMHEVKKTRKVSEFFKKHKKGILIATGLAMVAVTSAIFSPIIIPSLMSANATLASLTTSGAIKSLFHGLNTALAKTIGATFMNSQWLNSAGAVITSTVAKGGLLAAIGTYGVWGAYGVGFVKAIKNMFKAVDLPSETDKEKESKNDINTSDYIEIPVKNEEVKVKEKNVENTPTLEELRESARKEQEDINKLDVKENLSNFVELKDDEELTETEDKSHNFYVPTQEELRRKSFIIEDEPIIEHTEVREEIDSSIPIEEELRGMKSYYSEGGSGSEMKAPSHDEYFGPTQEELRNNVTEDIISEVIREQKEDSDSLDESLGESSLVEELRRNAPKEIIEIKEENIPTVEKDEAIPTIDELRKNAFVDEIDNDLVNVKKSDEVEDGKVEIREITLPDDNLSAEDFEKLIRELQENNAAKKEKERLENDSFDYSVRIGF